MIKEKDLDAADYKINNMDKAELLDVLTEYFDEKGWDLVIDFYANKKIGG